MRNLNLFLGISAALLLTGCASKATMRAPANERAVNTVVVAETADAPHATNVESAYGPDTAPAPDERASRADEEARTAEERAREWMEPRPQPRSAREYVESYGR